MTYCNIHFRVKFFTNFYETVALLGNINELGNWSASKPFYLRTSDTLYPYWETEDPIKVPTGAKLEFKFCLLRDGYLIRWENLPLGENRFYRSRYYLVTLECSEALPNFREDINKRFISSASLENLDEFKRVKKGRKTFDPFVNAQYSPSSDSMEESSGDKFSSDDLNSVGNVSPSPLRLTNGEGEKKKEFDFSIKDNIESNHRELHKGFGLHKASDLESLLLNQEKKPEALSNLYNTYKKQRNLPKSKPTCLTNCDHDEESNTMEIEDEAIDFASNDPVIYVSFKLPISVSLVNPEEAPSAKRWKITVNNNTHLSSMYRFCNRQVKNMSWIGWIGTKIAPEHKQELTELLYKDHKCIPIFLDDVADSQIFYEYCDRFLHDAFFNILDMKTVFSQESYVESYNRINQIYVDKILKHADLKTLILVQDYHLMMIPKYLSKKDLKYNVNYIFETPFPTLEVMKVFYNKKELLESLLCSDMICFNTSEYIKMFCNISSKLLNIHLACEKGGYMYLRSGGRKIYIRVAYPSIDPSYINDLLKTKDYIDVKNSIVQKYASKTLIIGVTHFTKVEGIETLIHAVNSVFESDKSQNYHFCLMKFEDVYKHDNYSIERQTYSTLVKAQINTINESMRQKGLNCEMEVLDETISEEKKLALMEASKLIIAFSPYLDNDQHIIEYLFTKVTGTGSIILSEFSHGHKHLNSLIKVNPFNKIEIIEGIKKGLKRNIETTAYLLELDRNLIINHTAWDKFHGLLNDLKKIQSIKSRLNLLKVEDGGEYRILAVKDSFRALDSKELLQNFKKAKKRIVICGYEGTLISDQIDPKKNIFDTGGQDASAISSHDMDVIRALSLIPDVSVYIISAKKVDIVAKEFESVHNATLIAENGFYYKMGRESKWLNIFQCDWSWKSIVQRIMQNYANRTEGVKIEIKESSIIWNHEEVRSEIAKIQENELVNHLTTVLTHVKNLEIVKEKRYVEVKPAGISKGIICELIMEHCKIVDEGYPDFILCMGVTTKDEEVFSKLDDMTHNNPEFENKACFTCVVERKPSNAKYFVRNIPEAFEFLRTLVEN